MRKQGLKISLFSYLLGIANLSTMMNLSLVSVLQKHVTYKIVKGPVYIDSHKYPIKVSVK